MLKGLYISPGQEYSDTHMDNIFIELENRDILSKKCERAFLIEIEDSKETAEESRAHLRELDSLVRTMGIEPVFSEIVKLRKINNATLLGKGKIEEIMEKAEEAQADLFIFDWDLSPSQQRNLERIFNQAVIDRQEVILDIFADRASTKEANLQVALARMEYSLPRLTRAWTHLSRQRGGAKGTRGKGETQLETDRRLVQERIARLKKDIKQVRKNRDTQRKKRDQIPFPSVAIVGYTNAGKSSLLNALTGADVLVEDKLFATLDPTSRKLKLPGGREAIMTDTVGFVRKLPHLLVDAFMSTLEEAARADLILNVVDGSSDEVQNHLETTEQVLDELGAHEVPRLLVVNKADQIPDLWQDQLALTRGGRSILVSARSGLGLDKLKESIEKELSLLRKEYILRFPQDRWDLNSYLHRAGAVVEEKYEDEGIWVKAHLSDSDASRLQSFILNQEAPPSEK